MHRIDTAESLPELWRDAKSTDTWRSIVVDAFWHVGGTVRLDRLYSLIEPHPKTAARAHWRAKVRQVLQTSSRFVRVGTGTWSLASKHTDEEVKEFEACRRKRYPRKDSNAG